MDIPASRNKRFKSTLACDPTERLWAALETGSTEEMVHAIRDGGHVNQLRNGRHPLDALEAFPPHAQAGAALTLTVLGARSVELGDAYVTRIRTGLAHLGFQCTASRYNEAVGMHMLPPSLFPLYLEAVLANDGMTYPLGVSCTAAEARQARIDLWKAIRACDDAGVLDALSNGADPNHAGLDGRPPLAAVAAFPPIGAALASLYLIMFGARFDATDGALMDRLDLALLTNGFGCGGEADDSSVGMHMLPSSLYPLYIQAVQRAQGGVLDKPGDPSRGRVIPESLH